MGRSARLAELPGWARALLERARVARLGLIDDGGRPRVLPVTYALAGETLVTVVDRKPKRVEGERLARVRWLRTRPQAALTVDRYDEDWSQLAWVQALGSVRILDPASAPDAMTALIERYAPYRTETPPGPLLVLEPERVLWWRA
jgi:PPOX class probable F420-dependent enzyme